MGATSCLGQVRHFDQSGTNILNKEILFEKSPKCGATGIGSFEFEGDNFPFLPLANFVSNSPLYGLFYTSLSVLCCYQQKRDHKMLTGAWLGQFKPKIP